MISGGFWHWWGRWQSSGWGGWGASIRWWWWLGQRVCCRGGDGPWWCTRGHHWPIQLRPFGDHGQLTADSFSSLLIMHLLYHCINHIHFDYFIFLYADIYLISSARNKDIMLSTIKLFPRLHWHPPKQGRQMIIFMRGTSIFILPVFPYLTQRVHLSISTSMSFVSGLIWTFLRERKILMEPSVMSVSG